MDQSEKGGVDCGECGGVEVFGEEEEGRMTLGSTCLVRLVTLAPFDSLTLAWFDSLTLAHH
jgi:hypothetical protein